MPWFAKMCIITILGLQWVLQHLVKYLMCFNSMSVRHNKNIQDQQGRGGGGRITLSNQDNICDNQVQNATGNAYSNIDICAISLATAIMVNITKNRITDTSSRCHILYITRTHFSCRFRIWRSEFEYWICVMCYRLICIEWKLVQSIHTWQVFQLSVSQILLSEDCNVHLHHGRESLYHCCTYCLND